MLLSLIFCEIVIKTNYVIHGILKIENAVDENAAEYKFVSTTSEGTVIDVCSVSHTLYKLNHVSKDITHVPFENGKTKTFECNIKVRKCI